MAIFAKKTTFSDEAHFDLGLTNMVVYKLEQRWEILRQIDVQKMTILAKNNHLFKWRSFWSWRVCKQVKLSHLGHRKPARIHWKANAPKTSPCLVRILVQRHNCHFSSKMSKKRPFQSMAIVIGLCWMNFCSQELNLGEYWQHLISTGWCYVPKLHMMFCALFLKIASLAAELISFGHLGAAIWHRWTNICGEPSKISVTPTSQRQLKL